MQTLIDTELLEQIKDALNKMNVLLGAIVGTPQPVNLPIQVTVSQDVQGDLVDANPTGSLTFVMPTKGKARFQVLGSGAIPTISISGQGPFPFNQNAILGANNTIYEFELSVEQSDQLVFASVGSIFRLWSVPRA